MADDVLDAGTIHRDRQRYHRLLAQAEREIAVWNERAGHLRQTIESLDSLAALADPGAGGTSGAGSSTVGGAGVRPAPVAPAPPRKRPAGPKRPSRRADPAETAIPAAPAPLPPPGAGAESEAPKGTDALRVVFQGDPARAWSLPELLQALEGRGWLPRSRRPEEGVRISLKRLVERGGAVRTPTGGWQLPPSDVAAPPEPPLADPSPPPLPEPVGVPATSTPSVPVAPVPGIAAEPAAGLAQEREVVPTPTPAPPQPGPRLPSFGRPVGATISEL